MKRLYAILAFLLFACTAREDLAGGVDGNPNFLQGKVVLPGGEQPAESLQVILWAPAPHAASLARVASRWTPLDTTYTDSVGFYQFFVSIDGEYRVEGVVGDQVVYEASVSFAAAEGALVPLDTLDVPAANSVMIDNFERDSIGNLGGWFADASPWVIEHWGANLLSILDTSVVACGIQGECYHLHSEGVGDSANFEQVFLYNILRPYEQGCVSLPSLDSLVVKAKGAGVLYLGAWGMDSTFDWNTAQLESRTDTLSGEWQQYSFPLAPNLKGTCLHKIIVGMEGPGELWVDDIQLYGINLLDL